jgi:hypothetical protein
MPDKSSCGTDISGLRVRDFLEDRLQRMPWNQNSSADSDAGYVTARDRLISRDLSDPQDFCDFTHRENGRTVAVIGHSLY